ncbi:unnamed protein product [Musa textilis]
MFIFLLPILLSSLFPLSFPSKERENSLNQRKNSYIQCDLVLHQFIFANTHERIALVIFCCSSHIGWLPGTFISYMSSSIRLLHENENRDFIMYCYFVSKK